MDNSSRAQVKFSPTVGMYDYGYRSPASSARPGRSDAGIGSAEARGDAGMNLSNDARNTVLEHLKEALNWCADNRDWDAVLFIVTLMRKTHDEP